MTRIKIYITILFLLATFYAKGQICMPHTDDSLDVSLTEQGDSLYFNITSHQIGTQLTFLMQGLTILIDQTDTLTLSFPSAQMVKHKVRRHPNEVKASFAGKDSANQIVRPDVQPLVAALNDTTATLFSAKDTALTHHFNISVDRETAIMTFCIAIEKGLVANNEKSLSIQLISNPPSEGERKEFRGNRLSREHSPIPNGLGEGLRKDDISNKAFRRRFTLKIKTL